MAKMKTVGGSDAKGKAAAMNAAKKSGMKIKKASGLAAIQAKDKKAGMPAFRKGGSVKGKCSY
jgi:hypothetical protein